MPPNPTSIIAQVAGSGTAGVRGLTVSPGGSSTRRISISFSDSSSVLGTVTLCLSVYCVKPICGWPAAVVRCGQTEEGLPIGVQVAAHPRREDVALRIAGRLEEHEGALHPARVEMTPPLGFRDDIVGRRRREAGEQGDQRGGKG